MGNRCKGVEAVNVSGYGQLRCRNKVCMKSLAVFVKGEHRGGKGILLEGFFNSDWMGGQSSIFYFFALMLWQNTKVFTTFATILEQITK